MAPRDRLPFGDRQAAFGEARDAADHDHREDQRGDERTANWRRRERTRTSAVAATAAGRARSPSGGAYARATRAARQGSTKFAECDVVTSRRLAYIRAMAQLAIPDFPARPAGDRPVRACAWSIAWRRRSCSALLASAGGMLGAPVIHEVGLTPGDDPGRLRARPRHPRAWLHDAERDRRPRPRRHGRRADACRTTAARRSTRSSACCILALGHRLNAIAAE